MGPITSSPFLTGALVTWQGLFTSGELDAIERHGDSLAREKAALSDRGGGHDGIRITQVAWFTRDVHTEAIYRRMEETVLALNARYFHYDLSGLTTFQYAVYRDGGHFDWHKDYGRDPNAPQQEPRKLTLSLQLSQPGAYQGCELQVRAGNKIDTAPKVRGAVAAFPANVLHRVTPIASGTRKALVIWAAGPEFR